ncbi:MAG: hypothetical protein EP330_19770 [Deltaproteobacteria bacterium]|nr:MAG: hypothetical protein EP330_19770 [Deltaproteobacteria bacterium]
MSEGDLSVTAQYTSQAWIRGGFPYAELFDDPGSQRVFGATNSVMGLFAWFRPGAPSLPDSLIARHAMLDHLGRSSGCRQFVEVAAGLSRRGATFSEEPECAYVEVDLPGMVATKERLLGESDRGRAVLARANLRRVGMDARELELDALLGEGPVCCIAEGLLMYFDRDTRQAFFARMASQLAARPGSQLIFDLVPATEQPKPGLVGRMLGWLMRRFTQGRGFEEDQGSREDLVAELRAAGFEQVQWFEPADLTDAQLPAPSGVVQTLVWRASA